MLDWIRGHEQWMWWLAMISVLTFVTSLVAVPWMLVRIPPRYFMSERHEPPWADRHPLVRAALVFGKNVLGFAFLVLGALMLVLPGQGILTIIAGIVLLDFPGKHRLLLWFISRPAVLNSVNWVRARAGHEPLQVLQTERVEGRG